MTEAQHFKFTNAVIIAPLVSVIAIWTVFWLELRLHTNFNEFGIVPQTFGGLRGILLSPFIHGSLEHLYNNTLPLGILTAALFYFYRKNALMVLCIGIVISGLGTWLIGRPSYHIGASGLIYVLASFIFFKGIFTKYYRLIALSLIVVFIYGSMLWYIFPVKEGMSWEGHLAGFLTGLLLAVFVRSHMPAAKKYDWEREDYDETDDVFLKHFDENGNFMENVVPEQEEEPIVTAPKVKITYHFKKRKPSDTSD